jgi:hypothetical protein
MDAADIPPRAHNIVSLVEPRTLLRGRPQSPDGPEQTDQRTGQQVPAEVTAVYEKALS